MKKINLLILFIIIIFKCGIAAKGADTKENILRQGTELFRQANEVSTTNAAAAIPIYQKSLMRFNKLVNDYGIENGKLYYNIGNIYFKMDDIGRAILNYKRAMQYMPNDENLIRNLHYAMGKRVDSFEERQSTKVLKTLFFWHYDFPVKVRLTLFAISFVLLWLFAIIRLFVKRAGINWMIGICTFFSLMFFVSLTLEYFKMKTINPGVIVAREVVARKGDSNSYAPSFKKPLHAGTEFLLKENRNKWVQVELDDGSRCWLPSSAIELVRKK